MNNYKQLETRPKHAPSQDWVINYREPFQLMHMSHECRTPSISSRNQFGRDESTAAALITIKIINWILVSSFVRNFQFFTLIRDVRLHCWMPPKVLKLLPTVADINGYGKCVACGAPRKCWTQPSRHFSIEQELLVHSVENRNFIKSTTAFIVH